MNNPNSNRNDPEFNRILSLCESLPDPTKRIESLSELNKIRDPTKIAPVLWCSFGCTAALIQEILYSYSYTRLIELSHSQLLRVYNTLGLLYLLASHYHTRKLFIRSNIVHLIFPLLNFENDGLDFEFIRLTALGIISKLISSDEEDIIDYLLNTELYYHLAKTMESSNELAKTVATYSFYKIISLNKGLIYICHNKHRLLISLIVLGKMINKIRLTGSDKSKKLLKHIIRCYSLIMDEREYGKPTLSKSFPFELLDEYIIKILDDDKESIKILKDMINSTKCSSKTPYCMKEINRIIFVPSNN